MIRPFLAVVGRDLRLARRHGAETTLVVAFFALTGLLFPLGLGPEPERLAATAGGAVWIAALLASLLSLDRLFAADAEDGSLDQLALSPLPLEMVVLAKAFAHWLACGVPLVGAAVPMAVILALDGRGLAAMIPALLAGTAILSLTGTVGAALTVGARRGGVLIPLLLLPLELPVLVFGAATVESAAAGLPVEPQMLILGALLAATLPLAPLAAAAALRHTLT